MYGRDRNCFSGRGGDDAVGTLASLETMFSVERRHRCRDYLRSSESSSFISPNDRRKMVNWMYRVIDVSNKLPRDIVIAAMTIVDRFVSLEDKQEFLRERSKYQLLIMVSIRSSAKNKTPLGWSQYDLHSNTHGHRPTYDPLQASLYISFKTISSRVAVDSHAMSKLSNGQHSAKEIEEMEMVILSSLDWRLNTPTCCHITGYMLALVYYDLKIEESAWRFILEEVRFVCEFSVHDYYCAIQLPSTVALASIATVLDQIAEVDTLEVITALVTRIGCQVEPLVRIFLIKRRLKALLLANGGSPVSCPSDGGEDHQICRTDDCRHVPNKTDRVYSFLSPTHVSVLESRSE